MKKLIQIGLLATTFLLSWAVLSPASYADDSQSEQIVLERHGFSLISEIVYKDDPFNTIAIDLDHQVDGLMVNFNPLEGGVWEPVIAHDDGFGVNNLLFTAPTHTVQFKKSTVFSFDPITINADIFYQDSYAENFDTSRLQASGELIAKGFEVIPRRQWGADESLRYWTPDEQNDAPKSSTNEKSSSLDPCEGYDGKFSSELGISRVEELSPTGDILTWPLQYMTTVQKFVVHHTDSEIRDLNGDSRMDTRDYGAIVQAIYRFHTLTRGWGDIGYNYLIDPLGNIYEGRYGGEMVIGAHAACYNNGTIGIALIGNYEDNEVPEPALQALMSLIASKSKQYGIDPAGTGSFRGKTLPNVMGHKDVRPTSCPGTNLYNLLPTVRNRVSIALRSGVLDENQLQVENLDYNAELSGTLIPLSLSPNERRKFTVKFKNTGTKSWDNNTWMHVALNNNPRARVVPLIDDKPFVAADMMERSVAPGSTGTFELEVEAGYFDGDYNFEISPVVNGRYKVSRASVFVNFHVNKPTLDYELVSANLPSGTVFQGQDITASVDLKNTGNVTWRNYGDNQITLGTAGPQDRITRFIERDENARRLGYLYESEIKPGQVGHFVMNLQVPTFRTGAFSEGFSPVIEYVGWMKDKGLKFQVNVVVPQHLARIIKVNNVNSLLPGETAKIDLQLENRGDLAWNIDNMYTTILARGIKLFRRQLIPLEPIEPGQKADFDFWVEAPYLEGNHSIFLRSLFNKIPIRGGVTRYIINVPKPILMAQTISQSTGAVSMRPGQEVEVTATIKNTGNVIWRNKGANAIYLAPSRPRDRLSSFYVESDWENKYRATTMEEIMIRPGETATFKMKVKSDSIGTFTEDFQLVLENVGWLIGGDASWTFTVSGVPVKSTSAPKTDAEVNKARAAVVTSGKTSTTTSTTSTGGSDGSSTTPKTTTVTTPVSTAPKVTERPFRVRISYFGDDSTLTANTPFDVQNTAGEKLYSLAAGDLVKLHRDGNNVNVTVGTTVKSASVIRFVPQAGGIVGIVTYEKRPTWDLKLNDNQFRDVMEVRVVNSQMAYINELPLESYLKGLAEVSNDSPPEKQKTIAVLARTYARFYMLDENRKFPGLPYDGNDDPAIFQRYLGYGVELRSPNFVAGVNDTKDKVVTYQGKMVKTPYFNQSDGKTRSAQEVWGWTDTPYLKSVADPWCDGKALQGHGVGLSGFGATAQANEGKTYEEIIKYYYSGVAIEKLNFN